VLNAVTNARTHGSGKRDSSHQFWDSFYGVGETAKVAAYDMALKLAA
jgi:hypothetical protein